MTYHHISTTCLDRSNISFLCPYTCTNHSTPAAHARAGFHLVKNCGGGGGGDLGARKRVAKCLATPTFVDLHHA